MGRADALLDILHQKYFLLKECYSISHRLLVLLLLIQSNSIKLFALGRGGGLVVSVLAFYSDDPSSIPAEVYNFFCKNIVEKNENKQKEAGVGP